MKTQTKCELAKKSILHPSHPISVHCRIPKLFDQLIIDNNTNGSSNNRYQLSHLCNVNIVTIFLLKSSPVKLIDIFRKLFLVPIFNLRIHFASLFLAGESKLKYIKQIKAFQQAKYKELIDQKKKEMEKPKESSQN